MGGEHVFCLTSGGRGHGFPMVQLAQVISDTLDEVKFTLAWPISEKHIHTVEETGYFKHNKNVTMKCLPMNETGFVEHTSIDFLENRLAPVINEAVEKNGPITSCIVDFFFWESKTLSRLTNGAPIWVYFTSPICTCMIFYKWGCSRSRLPEDLEIPCHGKILKTDLPNSVPKFDIEDISRKVTADLKNTKGLLINDTEGWYTPELLKLFRDSFPEDTPEHWKWRTIGPLTAFDPRAHHVGWSGEDQEINQWLSSKPERSVVYVALGSSFSIPYHDLHELAYALEACGKHVLWALRRPNDEMLSIMLPDNEKPENTDETTGLPKGYNPPNVHRQEWVNQIAVLAHPSVACFVTHCGWNSTLEGLTIGGLPLVCLPIGAEQMINAKFITHHLKAGVRLWDGPEIDTLDRTKIAEAITHVCANLEMQHKVKEIQALLQKQTAPGGQSRENIQQIVSGMGTPALK